MDPWGCLFQCRGSQIFFFFIPLGVEAFSKWLWNALEVFVSLPIIAVLD